MHNRAVRATITSVRYFRQIDARHTRLDLVAQCDQRRWIFEFVQRTEYQFQRFPATVPAKRTAPVLCTGRRSSSHQIAESAHPSS